MFASRAGRFSHRLVPSLSASALAFVLCISQFDTERRVLALAGFLSGLAFALLLFSRDYGVFTSTNLCDFLLFGALESVAVVI